MEDESESESECESESGRLPHTTTATLEATGTGRLPSRESPSGASRHRACKSPTAKWRRGVFRPNVRYEPNDQQRAIINEWITKKFVETCGVCNESPNDCIPGHEHLDLINQISVPRPTPDHLFGTCKNCSKLVSECHCKFFVPRNGW